MKQIDVVAGVIFDSRRKSVLLALRKPEQHQGDRWEFPGGKLEQGENPKDGLSRELLEEVGIRVQDSVARTIIEHQYPDKHVRLHFWDVTDFDGDPEGLEGQELRWVSLDKLDELRFPDANQAIVDALLAIS